MKNTKSLQSAYELLGNGLLQDIHNNIAHEIHVYHFNRLMACGIIETDAAQMIAVIASAAETAYENGDFENMEIITSLYEGLPETDPRTFE